MISGLGPGWNWTAQRSQSGIEPNRSIISVWIEIEPVNGLGLDRNWLRIKPIKLGTGTGQRSRSLNRDRNRGDYSPVPGLVYQKPSRKKKIGTESGSNLDQNQNKTGHEPGPNPVEIEQNIYNQNRLGTQTRSKLEPRLVLLRPIPVQEFLKPEPLVWIKLGPEPRPKQTKNRDQAKIQ